MYRLAYHFVWIPRYRRKVLSGDVAQRSEKLSRENRAARDWGALAVGVDHGHLVVGCPPRGAPAKVVHVLKSITARELYGELWAGGYYVGPVSDRATSDLVKRYTECRESKGTGQGRLLWHSALRFVGQSPAACGGAVCWLTPV